MISRARFVLLLLATIVLASAETSAAPPIPGAQSFGVGRMPQAGGVVLEKNAISLPPITADELLAGARPDRGSHAGTAVDGSNGLSVRGAIDPPPLAKSIRREIPGVWSYAPLPSLSGIQTPPQVRVQMRSTQGQPGALTLRDKPWITVPVELSTSQQTRRGMNGEQWYEGNIVIEIPVATLTSAGTYTGRIEISQESP